jgi:hypothetical protein
MQILWKRNKRSTGLKTLLLITNQKAKIKETQFEAEHKRKMERLALQLQIAQAQGKPLNEDV